mgnify:CR=1 FL=1
MKLPPRAKRLSIFLTIGIVWSLLSVLSNWFLIDFLSLPGWLGSAIVAIAAFFGRYANYLFVGLMHNHLVKYASTNLTFTLLQIPLISLSVDLLNFPAMPSSIAVIGLLSIFKFGALEKIGLIKR